MKYNLLVNYGHFYLSSGDCHISAYGEEMAEILAALSFGIRPELTETEDGELFAEFVTTIDQGEQASDIWRKLSDASANGPGLSWPNPAYVAELAFLFTCETAGPGYGRQYIDSSLLSYLVNGDASGLTEEELTAAQEIEKACDVVDVMPESGPVYESLCLVRYK